MLEKKISDMTESELKELHLTLNKKFEKVPSLPINARCNNPTCRHKWYKRSRQILDKPRKCPRCNSIDVEIYINKKWMVE